MARYHVRYVHKIAPSDKDTKEVELPGETCWADKKTLGKALRDAGVLAFGERVREFRVEGDKVIVFPGGPYAIWHSVILTSISPETRGT